MLSDFKIAELNRKRLENLNPKFLILVQQFLKELDNQGIKYLITSGYRSNSEQNYLYSLGRTRKGKIVTYKRGGQSKHNFGNAIDLAIIKNGDVDWSANYKKIYSPLAKKVGLDYGGDWKKFKDLTHLEI